MLDHSSANFFALFYLFISNYGFKFLKFGCKSKLYSFVNFNGLSNVLSYFLPIFKRRDGNFTNFGSPIDVFHSKLSVSSRSTDLDVLFAIFSIGSLAV